MHYIKKITLSINLLIPHVGFKTLYFIFKLNIIYSKAFFNFLCTFVSCNKPLKID